MRAWCVKHRALFLWWKVRSFDLLARARARKNAAHKCTQLHTFLFFADIQPLTKSIRAEKFAHITHTFAHIVHTRKRFAHKKPVLHTDFSFCTQIKNR